MSLLSLPPRVLVRDDIPHGRPLGVVRGVEDPRGLPVASSLVTAPASPSLSAEATPPLGRPVGSSEAAGASSATTFPTTVPVDLCAEAMTPAAIPWHRLRRRAPPLPLPAAASSATTHPTGVRAKATSPHGRAMDSSATAAFASPPSGSLVREDIPHDRPRGVVRGMTPLPRPSRGIVCGDGPPAPPPRRGFVRPRGLVRAGDVPPRPSLWPRPRAGAKKRALLFCAARSRAK